MKIDWIEFKAQCKKHIGKNLLVALSGALALAFLVLTLISLFSTGGGKEIAVKEAFDVSSSPLNGYLINYEDKKAEIERIIIVVGNGRERDEIELEGLTLYPRLAEEIRHEWKTSFDFDRIHSVSVVINGERQLLANSTAAWEFNPSVLLFALLCALCCFATIFTFKKRYYVYQEDLIAERGEETVEEIEEKIEEEIKEE